MHVYVCTLCTLYSLVCTLCTLCFFVCTLCTLYFLFLREYKSTQESTWEYHESTRSILRVFFVLLKWLPPRPISTYLNDLKCSTGHPRKYKQSIKTSAKEGYIYGKILSTFNNFFIDFSRLVYCCYLRVVRSTQTKLALKAAIGITKMPPGIGMSLHRTVQREGV